jgi:hypothetical protein
MPPKRSCGNELFLSWVEGTFYPPVASDPFGRSQLARAFIVHKLMTCRGEAEAVR